MGLPELIVDISRSMTISGSLSLTTYARLQHHTNLFYFDAALFG